MVRWMENQGQELHQITPQHNTRQDASRQDKKRHVRTRQDKTRQDKTRQDKTRQDKTRQNKPSRPISPPLPFIEQDRLHLCTLSTFSLETFHKRPYSCLSSIDTFAYPVGALCAMLWQCTHTSRTTIHTFIQIEKHEERGYTKRWCKNEGRKGISFKRRFLPYLSLASDLTPSHPNSTRLPTTATPDARKREGSRRRSSTMYRSCVKLKWHINFSLSNIYSFVI